IIKTKKINFINNFYCYDKKENLNLYKDSKDNIIYEDKRGGLFDTTYAYLILIWWGGLLSILVIIFIKIESKLIT
ncbi:MAG: hypothetical protein E7E72_05955, partial [Clostridium sp.]|nr:hypothetical protein [Clostridium sp.]